MQPILKAIDETFRIDRTMALYFSGGPDTTRSIQEPFFLNLRTI